jgi:hypothetical protein
MALARPAEDGVEAEARAREPLAEARRLPCAQRRQDVVVARARGRLTVSYDEDLSRVVANR